MRGDTALSGRYTTYPEYRESGVQMLGALPVSWQTKQVRYLLKDGSEGIKIGPFGSALKLKDMVESGTRVYGQENVIKKNFNLGKRRISQYKFQEMQVYQVYPDDLLITMMGTSGKCELVPRNADIGIIDSHLLRVRVKETEILPRFFRLLIDECYEVENQIKISGKGSIMHGLNSSIVKSLTLPLPSMSEQEGILYFLDHETTKIDTLIEKQQQLINLLIEKRQAVISHAVTKGLNPNAPMRDSGVEWLGEVPEHWDYCQIKHKCTEITDGAHVSPETEGGEHYFVSITDIKKGIINFDDALLTSPASYQYLIKTGCMPFPGDVLFSKDGTIGQTAITPDGIDFVVASSLIIIRPNREKVRPQYLDFLLQSGVVVEQVESFVKGAALRRLSIQNLLKVGGTFPPIEEQDQISEHLLESLGQYDGLEQKASDLITLQRERRTALISAAATGKIDVRDWKGM